MFTPFSTCYSALISLPTHIFSHFSYLSFSLLHGHISTSLNLHRVPSPPSTIPMLSSFKEKKRKKHGRVRKKEQERVTSREVVGGHGEREREGKIGEGEGDGGMGKTGAERESEEERAESRNGGRGGKSRKREGKAKKGGQTRL